MPSERCLSISELLLAQVLYAHVFGVLLLDEQESLLGILGSVLIASGVITVNQAKSGNASNHASLKLPGAAEGVITTPRQQQGVGIGVEEGHVVRPNQDAIVAFGHEQHASWGSSPFATLLVKNGGFWAARNGAHAGGPPARR